MTESPTPSGPRRPAPRSPAGPGVIIALLTIVGVIGGGLLGQPSLGLIAGFALGCGIGIVMWLLGRK